MKDKQRQGIYEFASFQMDVKQCRLTRDGAAIPLTPKEFDVLVFLIENSERVVEKGELLDAIWKDTFVEEGTLTRNISWLRNIKQVSPKFSAFNCADDYAVFLPPTSAR